MRSGRIYLGAALMIGTLLVFVVASGAHIKQAEDRNYSVIDCVIGKMKMEHGTLLSKTHARTIDDSGQVCGWPRTKSDNNIYVEIRQYKWSRKRREWFLCARKGRYNYYNTASFPLAIYRPTKCRHSYTYAKSWNGASDSWFGGDDWRFAIPYTDTHQPPGD